MSGHQDNAVHAALERNKDWCKQTASEKPDLFPALAKGQAPKILWLGCADSRVPETTILNLSPGDVFVHRNIANILPPTDLSSQSVLTYGVAHLKVSHIVVCGHTSCGGVAAALGNSKLGILDTWLLPLRQLRAKFAKEWEKEGLGEKEKALRLVEENVRQGVRTVRENAEVLARHGEVTVHGLVFDVGSGELREVECEGEGEEEVEARKGAFGVQ